MSENKRLNNYDELPLVLDVADIQRIMGISRVTAYELREVEHDNIIQFHFSETRYAFVFPLRPFNV